MAESAEQNIHKNCEMQHYRERWGRNYAEENRVLLTLFLQSVVRMKNKIDFIMITITDTKKTNILTLWFYFTPLPWFPFFSLSDVFVGRSLHVAFIRKNYLPFNQSTLATCVIRNSRINLVIFGSFYQISFFRLLILSNNV